MFEPYIASAWFCSSAKRKQPGAEHTLVHEDNTLVWEGKHMFKSYIAASSASHQDRMRRAKKVSGRTRLIDILYIRSHPGMCTLDRMYISHSHVFFISIKSTNLHLSLCMLWMSLTKDAPKMATFCTLFILLVQGIGLLVWHSLEKSNLRPIWWILCHLYWFSSLLSTKT